MVENPFFQSAATWQVELSFTHSNPHIVLDFLEDISLALDVDITNIHAKVTAYLPEEADLTQLSDTLNNFMEGEGRIINLSQTPVIDTDWVSQVQAEFQPFVTKYLQVVPYGYSDVPSQHKKQILLKPGRAFGNSEHATTQLCILAMEELYDQNIQPNRILDLGTGTGILAIAAHKLWADSKILALDIDQEAVNSAKENTKLNNIDKQLEVALSNSASLNQQFDLIVANILLGPLLHLCSSIIDVLAPGGRIILSGVLSSQLEELLSIYKHHGAVILSVKDLEGWGRVVITKP